MTVNEETLSEVIISAQGVEGDGVLDAGLLENIEVDG